jgi:excisionase family DNA binding protein
MQANQLPLWTISIATQTDTPAETAETRIGINISFHRRNLRADSPVPGMTTGSKRNLDDRKTYFTRADGSAVIIPNPSQAAEQRVFLTVDEAAELLRTSRKVVYSLIERGQLPGVTRLGRRILIRTEDLLHWLRQKSAPSPKET